MRRLLPLVAVAVLASAVTAAALVVPARGGDGDGAGDQTKSSERIAAFEECMRERGFEIGGREIEIHVRPGEVTINGERVDHEKFREAARACGGRPFHGPFGLVRPADVPEEVRERMERVERCLEQAETET